MTSTGGEGVCQGEGGEIKDINDLEHCVHHAEVCVCWEVEGEITSDPEVVAVAARRGLREALP